MLPSQKKDSYTYVQKQTTVTARIDSKVTHQQSIATLHLG